MIDLMQQIRDREKTRSANPYAKIGPTSRMRVLRRLRGGLGPASPDSTEPADVESPEQPQEAGQSPLQAGMGTVFNQPDSRRLIQTMLDQNRDFIKSQRDIETQRLLSQASQSLGQTQAQQRGLTNPLGDYLSQTGINSSTVNRPEGMNGRLPDNMLVSIGGGHRLQPVAAQAWMRMVQDAAAQGVDITLTDSYRDFAGQVAVAEEKGLYSQGGLAAEPGTSNHGWGLAVDVNQGREWLAQNANNYGFYTIPREPWHWEYRG